MYNKLIHALEIKDDTLHNEYIKLYIPEIITMLVLSFISIFDKVIANKIGLEVLTGVSMAAGYSEVMLMVGVAMRAVANVEYTKTKDLNMLGSFYKSNLILQSIIIIITIIIGSWLTYNSGLSDKSKIVSYVSLYCYGIYYLLVEYNRFQKVIITADKKAIELSKVNIITTVLNVIFDICVFVFNMHWVWIVVDNIITEFIGTILIKRIVKEKKMVYGKVYTILKYKDNFISSLIDSGSKRVLYVLMPFILSWLGDVKYAKYCIITAIVDQLISSSWGNNAIAVILLNDGYKWNDIKKGILKVVFVYAVIGSMISVLLCMLFGNIEINYILLIIFSFSMILACTTKCIYTGLNRYHSLYKGLANSQITCTVVCLLWLLFSVFITKNEYVSYCMWIIRDLIVIIMCEYYYKKFIRNNKMVD